VRSLEDGWMDNLLGRQVIVYYDDKIKVSWKKGKLTSVDTNFICLDNITFIPISNVVRMEVAE